MSWNGNAAAADDVDRLVDVRGAERDVLDALALIFAQELLDLALVVLALVQRDADLAAGRGHRLGEEAGLLALDVEVADLAEVEEPLVEIGPDAHPAAVHVVGEMVDVGELRIRLGHPLLPVGMEVEVDLVDRPARRRSGRRRTGASRRCPRSPGCRARRRPSLTSTLVAPSFSARSCAAFASLTRNAIAQALGPWALRIFLGIAAGLGIDDEVAVALLVQRDVLALVPRDLGEAHLGEQRRAAARCRARYIRRTRSRRCPSGCRDRGRSFLGDLRGHVSLLCGPTAPADGISRRSLRH